MGIIHSNKSQNNRFETVNAFDEGRSNILIATDVIARGVDFDEVSHVINLDVPEFPENYMHRIGRTGRAEKKGHSILLFTEFEEEYKLAIEVLMDYEIPILDQPETLEISSQKAPEERKQQGATKSHHRNRKKFESGGAFHKKKEKNQKENLGNTKKVTQAKKFKKPRTKGDKIQNRRKK
jgi:ATP-dependent RNA helicase RhlE